jgi:hypothetical protein
VIRKGKERIGGEAGKRKIG